ncbi:Tigger transposable element-derived protein 7-like 4 [Homarus americanus]|uniref:Tigger transposable element-derived protein 7-like 4 n=1 Tax=Homarus americanus TaxID=6706 RepID=A0A8J5MTN8_HOMAM|nr:Tigger transposable element-derived protein 7-like 4 [Homarus americanus]
MPPTIGKRKRVVLSINDKLKILNQLKEGRSVASLAAEYNVGVTTVKDLRHNQDKIKGLSLKFDISEKGKEPTSIRKTLKLPKDSELEESVCRWFSQQRSSGVPIRGCDIQHAAERLAQVLGVADFKASSGWLWRFRKRHGISNKPVCGESLSADLEAIEPFREKLNKLIQSAKLEKFQLYNADETGLFWKAVPMNIQVEKKSSSQPGRKLNKQRVSALFCANADGSHRLKPAMVGKSRQPRMLKDGSIKFVLMTSVNGWRLMMEEAEIAASVQNQGNDEELEDKDNDDDEASDFKGEKLSDMPDASDNHANDPLGMSVDESDSEN